MRQTIRAQQPDTDLLDTRIRERCTNSPIIDVYTVEPRVRSVIVSRYEHPPSPNTRVKDVEGLIFVFLCYEELCHHLTNSWWGQELSLNGLTETALHLNVHVTGDAKESLKLLVNGTKLLNLHRKNVLKYI